MTVPFARPRPYGALLAAFAGGVLALSCRPGEGDRCQCGDDCRAGLVCVAAGRVLAADECNPVAGPGAEPGLCVDENEAGLDDDGGGRPDIFMDLGSKRDFDPGAPPDGETSDTGTGSSSGDGSSSSGSDGSSGTDGASSSSSSGSGSSGSGSESSGSGSSGSSDSGGSGSGTTAGT